jgi:AcrR family transcriptional regulator
MRTGGDKTRKRILAVAERLFSTNGFDATSVDLIARTAGVTKALIYYHFENKDDLALHLLDSIIDEVDTHLERRTTEAPESAASLRREIREEVEFLAARSRILSVMLAEAFRSGRRDRFLFRCAELVIRKGHSSSPEADGATSGKAAPQGRMVQEFFTGFIPLVTFVALRDKWCQHYGGAPEAATADFVEAFVRTHLSTPRKRR